MRVSLVSDLHLEFCPISLPAGETLLLAGDIMTAKQLSHPETLMEFIQFFSEVSSGYKQVYYIMGNHEHYHHRFENTLEKLRSFLEQWPNVRLLNNETVALTEKVNLFGGTLWTNYNNEDPNAMLVARQCMNDHRCIGYQTTRKFQPQDALAEHYNTRFELEKALAASPDKEFMVMTHHCPTFKSISPKYGNDPLNHAFSSELSAFILDNPRIKWWVHGHTHDSFDYMVGDCRVMCNPRGYTRSQTVPPENKAFNPDFSFEVP